MYSKVRKFAVLGAVSAMSLAGVSAAQATTVTVSPSGNTVTAAVASGVSTLLTDGSVTLNCTTSSATATVTTPAPGGLTVSTNALISFGGGGGSCRTAGIPFTVVCDGRASITVSGLTVGGVTPGRITGIRCVVSIPSVPCSATVTGSVNGRFTNGSPSRLTVDAPAFTSGRVTNQALAITGSTCGALLPNNSAGNVWFSGPSLAAVDYILASPNDRLTVNAV
jgi:hypothetical protein